MDEIWLFSAELFCHEVKKFNMKMHAESKEMDAEMAAIQAKYDAAN